MGFTLPAGAMAYWVGEAMGSTDLKDLPTIPEATMSLSRTMAANAVHLVGLLTGAGRYPSIDGVGS